MICCIDDGHLESFSLSSSFCFLSAEKFAGDSFPTYPLAVELLRRN